MEFESLWAFKETWGLILLFSMLIGAFIYAAWPSNKEKFDEAANMPLMEDDDNV